MSDKLIKIYAVQLIIIFFLALPRFFNSVSIFIENRLIIFDISDGVAGLIMFIVHAVLAIAWLLMFGFQFKIIELTGKNKR